MADQSPFEYEPQEAHDGDIDHDVEEEKELDEDDPFATVDNPSSAAAPSGPAFDNFSNDKRDLLEEETPLSVWETERSKFLSDRRSKAESDKAANLAKAKEELSKFYADADARLEKTKKVNRADEKNYKIDTAAIFANGTKWEKVNRLVNVAPKAGEKPGQSRVERYRKLLIQLKAEKAEKAAKGK